MHEYSRFSFFNSPIYLLIFLPNCGPHTIKHKLVLNYPLEKVITTKKKSTPPITVWVHGTRMLSRLTMHKFFNDKPCLKHATEIKSVHRLKIIADVLSRYASDIFPLETLYFFKWSGKLNAQKRQEAAKQLYHELKQVVADYIKRYSTYPKIQILAHSHGGNVVLNMVTVPKLNDNLQIDTIVFMAVPVQYKTMHLIGNSMFKKVYVLSSSLDFVQIIAPQLRKKKSGSMHYGIKFPPFSNRRFPAYKHVAQANIKINGRALFHNEFIKPRFLQLLSHILTAIDTCNIQGAAQYTNGHDIRQLLCVHTKRKYASRRNRIAEGVA